MHSKMAQFGSFFFAALKFSFTHLFSLEQHFFSVSLSKTEVKILKFNFKLFEKYFEIEIEKLRRHVMKLYQPLPFTSFFSKNI
ncbi:MAG: hypothetical protein COX62_01250 [Deltaproteobacteria bacterium CG_4_10_14_0_2_um_filter_43_8]|nr:MAG: hypothetical protein COV43_09390 [Deltaproteobacteria bacterium CG11_big_fil_rev_8_21_14_0_20_42_23]PJA21871.1 MAG: hypothetical protein COX62_01250 [Deltaproteobacteria bacterium CG_4_10_14_0_2_um_filter_43_8]PJC64365.1 MAG: hypothetical protein CO021_05015 [Deltaproteobacteria bacterium CG_4_9_14_0_2_um_filter_42_21]